LLSFDRVAVGLVRIRARGKVVTGLGVKRREKGSQVCVRMIQHEAGGSMDAHQLAFDPDTVQAWSAIAAVKV
jgi:hypothetical protein